MIIFFQMLFCKDCTEKIWQYKQYKWALLVFLSMIKFLYSSAFHSYNRNCAKSLCTKPIKPYNIIDLQRISNQLSVLVKCISFEM